MNILLSLYAWTASILLLLLLFTVDAILIVVSPFDKDRKIRHRQCFWWADSILALNPYWNLKVSGLENIDPNGTYVIIANHQSLADIMVVYKIRCQFKWIAKESLFKTPVLGGILRMNKHICLRRGDFSSIKKVYRQAAEWLRKDVSVLFFPEGTRTDTGEMNLFQNGAFKLAIKEKVPILPILIDGTREAIPKNGWVLKTKVNGRLKVLPPIDTSGYKSGEFDNLRDVVWEQLNKEISAQ